jgi:biotin carboxyl carrier protein
MGTAKPVSLRVRPLQAAHLAFEVDGILGESDTKLGTGVPAFDFSAFYAILGAMPTVPSHPARLLYDFLQIQTSAKPFALAALRAEPRKAALSKAINLRANAYYGKYANAPAIISQMNQYFSPSVVGSKPQRLAVLASISENNWNLLKAAYTSDNRTGVVKATRSHLTSTTRSTGNSTETGRSDEETEDIEASGMTLSPPPVAGAPMQASWSGPFGLTLQEGSTGEKSKSTGSATQNQTIVNTDYGYRVPYVESAAQYERAQISLIDQQFAQFMAGQNLPYLAAVFENELSCMDSDIYRLQISYLNTIMMSPIAGTVTGIYKNPGDAVKAGEPVVRVENTATVLITATLVYRGPITIGSTVTISTPLFDSSGPATTLTGSVVAARGRSQDDQWEVIVQCDNSGTPNLPLGYHFDYDDTTVSIN